MLLFFLTRPRACNDPFDLNPYITEFDEPVAMGAHLDAKMKDIVVLSLAENCDSLLMWAHYAVRHTGLTQVVLSPPRHRPAIQGHGRLRDLFPEE